MIIKQCTINLVREKLWKKKNTENSLNFGFIDKEAIYNPTCSEYSSLSYYRILLKPGDQLWKLLLPTDNPFTKSLDSYSISLPTKRKRKKWKPNPEINPGNSDSTWKEINCLWFLHPLFNYFSALHECL